MEVRALKAHDSNARVHSGIHVQQIADSIQRFGFIVPIIIDETNTIIAGHGRVLAARELHFDTVPAIRAHGLTDAERRAYLIADNKLSLNSDWDFEQLRKELKRLDVVDNFEIEITGFSQTEIDEMFNVFNKGDVDIDPQTGERREVKRKCPDCGHEWFE